MSNDGATVTDINPFALVSFGVFLQFGHFFLAVTFSLATGLPCDVSEKLQSSQCLMSGNSHYVAELECLRLEFFPNPLAKTKIEFRRIHGSRLHPMMMVS